MNPREAVLLTRYVKALCPQQKFDEFTPDAWHDVLGRYALIEARAAAAAVAGKQPFVSPAEIITEIRHQRGERARDFQGPGLPAEVPDADPDDVRAYMAALRAQRTRASDGMELKPRNMKQLLAGVGQVVPGEDDELAEVRRPGPLGVECPTCSAAIGRPCKSVVRQQVVKSSHPSRRRVANGEPAESESPELIEQRRQSAARLLAQADDEADAS